MAGPAAWSSGWSSGQTQVTWLTGLAGWLGWLADLIGWLAGRLAGSGGWTSCLELWLELWADAGYVFWVDATEQQAERSSQTQNKHRDSQTQNSKNTILGMYANNRSCLLT